MALQSVAEELCQSSGNLAAAAIQTRFMHVGLLSLSLPRMWLPLSLRPPLAPRASRAAAVAVGVRLIMWWITNLAMWREMWRAFWIIMSRGCRAQCSCDRRLLDGVHVPLNLDGGGDGDLCCPNLWRVVPTICGPSASPG